MNKGSIVPQNKKIAEKKDLVRRISVIDGQVNGIRKMIEEDVAFEKVLIQISAVNNSLRSLGNAIAEKYINKLAGNYFNNSEMEKLVTAINLLEKFNR